MLETRPEGANTTLRKQILLDRAHFQPKEVMIWKLVSAGKEDRIMTIMPVVNHNSESPPVFLFPIFTTDTTPSSTCDSFLQNSLITNDDQGSN